VRASGTIFGRERTGMLIKTTERPAQGSGAAAARWIAVLVALACILACTAWVAGGALSVSTAEASTETVVGFDNLTAGTTVTNQYEAQGLKLGRASDFGQASPKEGNGDCGPPTVQESPVEAASPPRYAVLAECLSPGPTKFSGTFGALVGRPGKELRVDARLLAVGAGAEEIELVAYGGSGQELANAKGEATSDKWRRIVLTLSGAAQIRYFMIRTANAYDPAVSVGIDDLGFEQPTEETSGKEPSPPGGTPIPPAPPSAGLALQTPNPAPGQELTISGAGSQGGSGRIISYDWDLNGDGKTDTSTGANPIAHLILAPGPHTIGLTVTSSNGQSSSSKLGVTIPSHISLPPPADGGTGPCEPTWEEGDAKIVAECVQKLSGGGYVIETKQLELNGMVLAPTGGGYGVFKIQTVKDFAIDGTATRLSGTPVKVELLNTPIGDVVLGGRDLESEPIQLAAHSGLNHLTIPLNHGLRGPRGVRGRASDDATSKTLLMAIGVGHECSGKESKKAGCCPPTHENTACATLPGNFPLTGQIVVYLTNKGQSLFDVQVGLQLKGIFEATGALEIEADPQAGINLNSLKFNIGEAGLESIFTVKNASFVYYFPSAPEESKRDTWQAKGTIVFGPLGEPSLEAELAFKKGQFHSASLVFVAPPPGIPIYPGVALNKLGGSVGVEPFSFGGSLGASIATQLELTLSFKYREATSTELGFFGGQGVLSLDDDEIATLAADVYSDGYIDAKLAIDLHLPFSSNDPIVKVGGNIGFWDEPSSGLWQAEGSVYLKLWEISAEVAGLVNNQYIAGCGEIAGFGVQGRYRFSDGNIDGGFFGFSNCSDQLKQYQQKPLTQHSGGFVGGGDTLRLPRARAAQGESYSFRVAGGQSGEELRFTSSSGTPVVTLKGPGGQTLTTPSAAGHIVTSGNQLIAAVAPDRHQVLVFLRHPQGGTWQAQALPGSPPIAKLEGAGDVAPAKVKVRVSPGHGRHGKWKLAYRIGHYVPGTHVRFVERGRDSTHVLGTTRGAKGTIAFVPQDAVSRARRIVAYLLSSEGAPQRVLTVGRYLAPGAAKPRRVKHLRIVRHGLAALVSWSPAAGARVYAIKVRGSDGRLETLHATPRHRSVVLTNVLPFESFTVNVTARGGPNMLPGPGATAKLRAVKVKRTGKARGSGRHRGRKRRG